MKRARIIYNPTSGREAFKKNLPEVLARFEIAGYETSCHATTCAGDATEAAKAAVERGFDIIVAVGGDGTLNEVVAGVSQYEVRRSGANTNGNNKRLCTRYAYST